MAATTASAIEAARSASSIQASLSDTSAQLELGAERLRTCLALVHNVPALYERLPDRARRQANHTFYRRFYLVELPDQSQIIVSDTLLNPPFDEIREAADLHSTKDVNSTPALAHIFRSVVRVSEFWWAILGLNQ